MGSPRTGTCASTTSCSMLAVVLGGLRLADHRIEVDDDSLAATMLPSGAFVVWRRPSTTPWRRGAGPATWCVWSRTSARPSACVEDQFAWSCRSHWDKDAWTGAHLDLDGRRMRLRGRLR